MLDKKQNKKLIDNLEKLGLTPKEVQVYLYLMARESEVGSSKIVNGTNLHGQYVYTALEALEKKGLVKHVVKSNRKKWLAGPTNRLESLVEEKRIIANEVKDSLESMFIKKPDQEFEVYQGEDQIVAHEFKMIKGIKENGSIDIIGGQGDKFSQMLADRRVEYNVISIEKNIKVRFIGSESQRKYLSGVKENRVNFDFRIMPKLISSSINTSIYPDSILFLVYGDPILIFKIKSEQIAQDYRTFFDSLWELCSKDKKISG